MQDIDVGEKALAGYVALRVDDWAHISIKTTPTGVPHIGCRQCGYGHPINQKHCKECGSASLFVHPEHLVCLKCGWPDG